jgi:hypothetical protein
VNSESGTIVSIRTKHISNSSVGSKKGTVHLLLPDHSAECAVNLIESAD